MTALMEDELKVLLRETHHEVVQHVQQAEEGGKESASLQTQLVGLYRQYDDAAESGLSREFRQDIGVAIEATRIAIKNHSKNVIKP